jgi:adenine deaminase
LRAGPLTADRIREVCDAGPALHLTGLITRRSDRSRDDLRVALVDQAGGWVVGCTLGGLGADAIASTHTGGRDVFLAGRDPDAMVSAYERVVEAGGGVATPQGLVPLPILGTMFDGTVAELAAAMDGLTPALDLPAGAPLDYLPLFLTIASLPDVRLISMGVVDVKSRTVLAPPVALS